MMNKNFGEKTANVLMDWISPIPRKSESPGLYTKPRYQKEVWQKITKPTNIEVVGSY